MSNNPFVYDHSVAEETDGYHLTTLPIILTAMQNIEEWGVANLALRGDSEKVSYTVIAGLWELLHKLEHWIVDDEVVQDLKSKNVPDAIIKKVAGRKFEGKVHAVRDGEIMFPGPVVRFEGPKWQIKWIESMFTNHLRRCCSVATKMSRARYAMKSSHIALEGALRRSNDTDGVWTSRSAYLSGANATSNVKAGKMFNIPWSGTVDHFTMQVLMEEYFKIHDIERDEESLRKAQRWAYRHIISIYPENYTLLVDTIDPYVGIEDAVIVLQELQPKNYCVRIDSGDLAEVSKWARKVLDKSGLDTVKIAPSGGLSAVTIKSLLEQDCPGSIWMFGEYLQFKGELARDGTMLQEPMVNVEFVSKYAGTADGVWESVKLSGNPAKNSLPGLLQRLRMLDEDGMFAGDVIVNESLYNIPSGDALAVKTRSDRPHRPMSNKTLPVGSKFYTPMQLVFEKGRFIDKMKPLYELEASRTFHQQQMEKLAHRHRRVDGSHSIYGVGIEHKLQMRGYELGMDKVIVHKNKA